MALEQPSSAALRRLPRTAQEIAASELRRGIVRGDLSPGQKIRQQETASQFGISLIPIREALKTLAGEGIVSYIPQRGYFVTELPDQAIREIYQARDVVETEVERLAVPRVADDGLAAMESALRSQQRAVEDRDPVAMISGNRAFHFAIFDRSPNPWLLRFVTQLWDTIDPYRVISYRRMWDADDDELVAAEILAEHTRILTSLQKRREDRALTLLRRHRSRSESFVATLSA